MNRAARRAGFAKVSEHVAAIAKKLTSGKQLSPHVLLGPVAWLPDGAGRKWYFVIICDEAGTPQIDEINSPEKELVAEFRSCLRFALTQQRPIVIHDFEDELDMARWAEGIWPVMKIRDIREKIEEERARWSVHPAGHP